ncbi:hypothetical protein SAMN04487897_108140 [Paenibacillus sp. yr247]|uniref:hypothetical protein n=1 Tax=Paenibacillus sp. yr247 TaxID=1761880 RepID=UPI00088C09AA|nr:hypothetical protein [Paenibacillus sp. yr247]SDO11388.1 hypothetical protein SAMN04487897_108140 [Paenibacillus sp. yr247]
MDNKLNENSKKIQSISTTTDVLNTTKEVKESNQLNENSEITTPETCRASIDGN